MEFIGIDVSKFKLDVFSSVTNNHFEVINEKKAISKALKGFKSADSIVIIENTGGYENECVNTLIDNNFFVHKTNNNKVKAFSDWKNGQKKAKTDKIDARILSEYGQTMWNEKKEELKEYQKPTDIDQELKNLVRYLEELKRIRAAEKSRLQSGGAALIVENIKMIIKKLDEGIAAIENRIKELLGKTTETKEKVEKMKEYKGIGDITALYLAINLEELGKITRKQISSLAGLAPINRESGTYIGKRKTSSGSRNKIKPILYMSCLSAIRSNPEIKKAYKRFISKGKPGHVAMVACMRKILVNLNGMLRDQYYAMK